MVWSDVSTDTCRKKSGRGDVPTDILLLAALTGPFVGLNFVTFASFRNTTGAYIAGAPRLGGFDALPSTRAGGGVFIAGFFRGETGRYSTNGFLG